MSDRYDIVVCGLGPAGAAAARAAAQRGVSVLAVDRRAEAGVPVQCAEFVPALVAKEAGAITRCTRQTISRMTTFVETDEADVRDDFRGVMIDRAKFDAMLVAAAEAAGARCEFGVVVTGVAPDGVVRFRDGRCVQARVMIGADGPRSGIAKMSGFDTQEVAESRQMTVQLRRPSTSTDVYLSAEIVGGYGWLFPKGDVANLGVGVAHTEREQLKDLLDSLHRRLVDEGRVGPDVLGYTGGPIPVGGIIGPVGSIGSLPVVLAGDAAGLANPVTGAGINSAVVSGVMAGEAASRFVRGDARALDVHADEIGDLFGAALERASRHRRRLIARGRSASPAELRRGWIAYDDYWCGDMDAREAAQ